MRRALLLGLMVGFVYCSGLVAWGGIIKEHIGSNNPTGEGWTLDASGSYSVGPGTTPRPHWWITVNDGPSPYGSRAGYSSVITSNDVSDPSGWTFTALAQINKALYLNEAWLMVRDGQDSWGLLWIAGQGASLDPGLYTHNGWYDQPKKLKDFDTTDGFHYYQMIYNPATPNQISFYLDGVFIGTQTRTDAPNISQYLIFFGDGTGNNYAGTQSLWAWVRFETGQHIYVPEPSSGVLAGLAGLGFAAVGIAFRRKNRHRPRNTGCQAGNAGLSVGT